MTIMADKKKEVVKDLPAKPVKKQDQNKVKGGRIVYQ